VVSVAAGAEERWAKMKMQRFSKIMTSGEAQMRKMKKKSCHEYPLWRRRQLLTLRDVFGVMMSVCVCVDVCMCVWVLFRAERGRES
jgi:hypothetical protein